MQAKSNHLSGVIVVDDLAMVPSEISSEYDSLS